MLPLAFVLIASIGGDTAPARASEASLELAADAPAREGSLMWRSAAVAGGALCGMTVCGAAPVAGGAVVLSTTLRAVDPIAGYAIGLCCGAALVPLPGLCAGLFAASAGGLGGLLAGIAIDWSALAWAAGAAGMIGLGVATLAFAVAFPVGLILNESGQRAAATAVYGGVPLVVVSGGALLASAAAGGLYFLSGSTPDETVTDVQAWASGRSIARLGQ